MRRRQLSVRQRSPGALALARDWFDGLFDTAPVMMTAFDADCRVVKVNRRWLETMGYEKEDVLGRRPTHFQTEDSRTRAKAEMGAMPPLWRADSSHSMVRQFVGSGGEVLDIIVDVEVCHAIACECSTYGTLTDIHDQKQREEASNTLRTLKDITTIQQILESALATDEGDGPEEAFQALKPPGRVARAVE
ncbi:MAG: PAS domain-containing protein, partial [Chloroflexi bacterium]|nr:PAS domain-containing protein [Chloroflexota bacterium]